MKTMNYEGKELRLVQITEEVCIGYEFEYVFDEIIPSTLEVRDGEVFLKEGSIFYLGDNPYNGAQIVVGYNEEYEFLYSN